MANIDWPGLLAWSTKYHDGTAPSQFNVMSDEDREFLTKALEEAFGKIEDPNQLMKEAIDNINAPDVTQEGILVALEVFDKCVDYPDCNYNVEKLGGIACLHKLLNTPGIVRQKACELLTLFLSNNPKIQEAAFQRGVLHDCIKTLDEDSVLSPEEHFGLFRVVMVLVRQIPLHEETFLKKHSGLQVIMKHLGVEIGSRIREKAIAFAQSLVHSGHIKNDDADKLLECLIPLVGGLQQEPLQYRELFVSTVFDLASIDSTRSQTELAGCVKARISELKIAQKPEEQEEFEMQVKLFQMLSNRT